MQSETAINTEAPASRAAELGKLGSEPRWRTVDRTLRTIAARRAALDAEEVRWLREAEALQIWREFGMVSALDYLERVLNYAPRTAQDRLRVARALGSLSRFTTALETGELSFSAVRELTRVATPATEADWLRAATGKTVHEIEVLVANHRPGDHPDDPPNPQVGTRVVRFELQAETFAALRQAHQVLDDEHGRHLSDDAFITALCGAVLDGASATEPTGRAKFQVAVTVCERCRQGWQEGAGANIPISPAAVDRAMCDAQHIGSIDDAVPARAHQEILPSVARLVWHRDHGRCRVPGCRSSRGLELHHIIHRVDGGSHDPSNLMLACSACHQSHHAGRLTISGTADHVQVHRTADAARDVPATLRVHVGVLDPLVTAPATQVRSDMRNADAAPPAVSASAHRQEVASAMIAGTGAHMGVADPALTALTRQAETDMRSGDAALLAVSAGAHRHKAFSATIAGTGAHMGVADPALIALTRQAGTDMQSADAALPAVSASADRHEAASAMIAGTGAYVDVTDPALTAPSTQIGTHMQSADAALLAVSAGAHRQEAASATIAGTGAHVGAANPALTAPTTPARTDMQRAEAVLLASSASPERHDGVGATISVTGTGAHLGSTALTSRTANDVVTAATKLDAAILRTQAKQALIGLGWKAAVAQMAVAAAVAAQDRDATLEWLIFEALRRCPMAKR